MEFLLPDAQHGVQIVCGIVSSVIKRLIVAAMKLVVKNLEEVVQVCDAGQEFKAGSEQNDVATISRRADGCGCFVAVDDNGFIHSIGYDDQLPDCACEMVDGIGCSVIPGFIDSHTHPVWSGDRLFEFELKMSGACYLDIHNKGGGIYFTVNHTKSSSDDELLKLFLKRLDMFASHGTTVVDAKTGYGLDFETEHKMLRVIRSAQEKHDVEILTNLLVGHAVPKGLTADEGANHVVDIMRRLRKCDDIPKIDFVDVFCEKGVFNISQSREILTAGQRLFNAEIAFHGDELTYTSSAELAASLNAKSISHCEFISDAGIRAIAESKTVAIICPTTAFLLRLDPPPVRKMIEAGVIMAIASDFNPNAYCFSLVYAMQIAVIHSRLSLNEALVATTINAAFAMNKHQSHGSLEQGKAGDMIVIRSKDWRNLIYQMGQSRDLIKTVIKKGKIVHFVNN